MKLISHLHVHKWGNRMKYSCIIFCVLSKLFSNWRFLRALTGISLSQLSSCFCHKLVHWFYFSDHFHASFAFLTSMISFFYTLNQLGTGRRDMTLYHKFFFVPLVQTPDTSPAHVICNFTAYTIPLSVPCFLWELLGKLCCSWPLSLPSHRELSKFSRQQLGAWSTAFTSSDIKTLIFTSPVS